MAGHEFRTYLRRRSFILTTLAIPLFGLLVGLFLGGVGPQAVDTVASAFEFQAVAGGDGQRTVGYVDPGDFVTRQPPGSEDEYVELATLREAEDAVAVGDVDVAYVLPADYPAGRQVERVGESPEVRGADRRRLEALLRANLWPRATESELQGLAEPGKRVQLALDRPRFELEERGPAAVMAPLLVAVLLYSSVFTVASFLLQSVTTEKENRIIEILLTSTRPFELLLGKVVGLGALGLFQVAVWSGFGLIMANVGGLVLLAAMGLQVGPGFILAAFGYFALGYFFFASLMAAVGALAPSLKESGAITLAVLLPAWTPFFLLRPILSDPDGGLSRALTFFPPTAALVGLLRSAMGRLPAWEMALSMAVLLAAGLVVLMAAARLFASTVVLAGSLPGPGRIWRTIRG